MVNVKIDLSEECAVYKQGINQFTPSRLKSCIIIFNGSRCKGLKV